MSADATTLTAAVAAGLPEVSACVLLSHDGLPLACHPASQERRVMEQWARLAAVGDVERGFLVVGGEVWAFVREGRYTAVAVADAGAKPGVILVELEDLLRKAAEGSSLPSRPTSGRARTRDGGAEQSRRRRMTTLHARRALSPEPEEMTPEEESVSVPAPRPLRAADDAPEPVDRLELVKEFGGLLGSLGQEDR